MRGISVQELGTTQRRYANTDNPIARAVCNDILLHCWLCLPLGDCAPVHCVPHSDILHSQ